MGWLSFGIVAVLAFANVRVTTLDGKTLDGKLIEIGKAGVRLETSDATATSVLSLEQVLSIKRLERPTVAPATARVGLSSGSRIAVDAVTSEGSTAELTVRNQRVISLPLKKVRWIRFRGSSTAVDPQWLGLIDRQRVSDSLVVRRPGDSIDEISGIVLAIKTDSISFDLDGDTMQAPVSRLEGVLFSNSGDPPITSEAAVIVDDIYGSRWFATSLGERNESEVELNLAEGLKHRMPLDQLGGIELIGSVEFLASQTPVESAYIPQLSIGLSPDLVNKWFGPEIIEGNDLVVRATSLIEYRVSPEYQTFAGSIDFDPAVTSGGRCDVRISLDAKPVWQETFEVSDPSPKGFELPLGGARRVRIEVLAGGDGDIGDSVKIRQPRLTK